MGNFTLNLVNYSILHIDIDFVLVGMIANISDCEDIVFISNNNVFPFEIKFSWLKNGISCHLYNNVLLSLLYFIDTPIALHSSTRL